MAWCIRNVPKGIICIAVLGGFFLFVSTVSESLQPISKAHKEATVTFIERLRIKRKVKITDRKDVIVAGSGSGEPPCDVDSEGCLQNRSSLKQIDDGDGSGGSQDDHGTQLPPCGDNFDEEDCADAGSADANAEERTRKNAERKPLGSKDHSLIDTMISVDARAPPCGQGSGDGNCPTKLRGSGENSGDDRATTEKVVTSWNALGPCEFAPDDEDCWKTEHRAREVDASGSGSGYDS